MIRFSLRWVALVCAVCAGGFLLTSISRADDAPATTQPASTGPSLGTITVSVVDFQGNPAHGVNVKMKGTATNDSDGPIKPAKFKANKEGVVKFNNLPAGDYTLSVVSHTHGNGETDLKFDPASPDSGTATIKLDAPEGATPPASQPSGASSGSTPG